jgi:uncharacterized membrane protein
MAQQDTDASPDGASESMERLRHELVGFLGAQAHRLAGSAGDRVSDLVGRAGGKAKEATSLPKVGARMLGQEAKSMTGSAVDTVKKAAGGGTSGGKSGGKFTSIIESVDVGVPLRTCYDHWAEYEGFSDFMKGVQSVQRPDEVESDWKLKIGPSSRGWHATVQEQIPDDRIEWTSEGAQASTRGVVSFHKLAPSLTRIVVVVQYYPAGFFEKTANLWRAQGRRLRLDLKHFQRYVMLEADEVPEGWRGEIRDGEVVRGHEEGLADDRAEPEEEEEYSEDDFDEQDENGEEREER